ncbi:MAG TPA: FAD-dependent oxidoreductase [Pseudolysinimonas sp.]|jgi:thioredoxin reductase (NADPH)
MIDATPVEPPVPAAVDPRLSGALAERLRSYGAVEPTTAGQLLFRAGDVDPDFFAVESGTIEILSEATLDAPEQLIRRYDAGGLLGELSMLSHQDVYLTARVSQAGSVRRVTAVDFRRLMATEGELSDVLLQAFEARRDMLLTSASQTIQVVGHDGNAASLALRTYLIRMELPHRWLEAGSDEAIRTLTANGLPEYSTELPIALLYNGRVLKRTTPGELAVAVGHAYRPRMDEDFDLVVVGGGPAGMAAAVYGASEGLETICLDAIGPGGQAAASSRIENYLGFPSGLSGAELTHRAAIQALKFGARLNAPCEIVGLRRDDDGLFVELGDGTSIRTRAVIVATGAAYRRLPLDRWDDFEGAGIYFAATELEARQCQGSRVAVVGGANSAGQAALFLAKKGSQVDLVVRGGDLGAGMSDYLVQRLRAHPDVTIRTGTEVTALSGDESLASIELTGRDGAAETVHCSGLFCFIGATPATGWLDEVALDEAGFVLTDVQVPDELSAAWPSEFGDPLPFETSIPGVFAAGDVRIGSMKRVAAAVGEGASAVASVHRRLAARETR